MTSQAKIVVSADDRASRILQQVRGQLASTAESAGKLAAGAGLIGPAFAGLASAAGLVGFVRSVATAVDALNDVADATGASIETLSGLERVARMNGGTLDDVSGILVKFNKALTDAQAPGSAAAQVFAALGLSAKQLQGADPAEALRQAAVALAGYADDGNKARVVQELFGRSVKDAAPFLKDLAAAGTLNGQVTREQAEQAERFNKALYALQTTASDVGRNLVTGLGGALAQLIERFKTAQQVFGSLSGILSAGLKEKLNFSDAAEGLREYNRQIATLDERIQAINRETGGDGPYYRGKRLQALQAERDELAKVADYYRTLNNAGSAGQGRGGVGGTLPSLQVPDKPAAPRRGGGASPVRAVQEISESQRALASYVEQLQREADKTGEITEKQRALNLLRSIGVQGQIPQVRELVLRLAEEADLREQGLAFAKAMTAEMERQATEQRNLDDALNNFAGRTADALKRAQVARLEARMGAGEAFSPEELERIIKGIGGIRDAAEDTFDASAKSLERFATNVQDALGTTLEATLRGDFDNIGKLWSNLLLKMAAEALAADLAGSLFGNLGKGGAGGGGGLLGGLIGSIFGVGPGRAGGGSVNPMSVQPVNERGFEVFSTGGQDWLMTARGGKVIPNNALGGQALSVSVGAGQVFNIGQGVSRSEVFAAVSHANAANRAAIMRTLRERGVTA